MSKTVLFWFKNDLRINDNPGLNFSSNKGLVFPIYIHDENSKIGSASKLWLHNSLLSLDKSLDNNLNFFSGNSLHIILSLCKKHNIQNVVWNKSFEPELSSLESKIEKSLRKINVEVNKFNAVCNSISPQFLTRSYPDPPAFYRIIRIRSHQCRGTL